MVEAHLTKNLNSQHRNTAMNTYSQAELNTLKLADITDLYNQYATVTGAKQVKKFRDKPTAVKRTLDIQEQLPQPEPEVTAEPEATTKPAKKASKGNSKTDMTAQVVIVKQRNNGKGSIGEMMFAYISANHVTVQELVDYMVANYSKPRSSVPVTAGFVINTIRYFVREGSLKFA